MRSIRLSLVLYFLGLLLVALGAASYWTYHLARTALDDKKKITEELIQAQYLDRSRQVETRLNEALLLQAQTLARIAFFYSDSTKAANYRLLSTFGILTAVNNPNAWATIPIWGMETIPRGPVSDLVFRRSMGEIKFNEVDLFQNVDGQIAEYFQIDSSWGSSYRSASLGKLKFPAVDKSLTSEEAISWEFSEENLDGVGQVRRVVLKAPATRLVPWGALSGEYVFQLPNFRGPQRDRNPPAPARPAIPSLPGPRPSLVIQCACDLDSHHATLAGFAGQRDEEIQVLNVQTDRGLANLRGRLWWMAGCTFSAMILGTLLIVGWGLMPLERLSGALGNISPRDFKLPLDRRSMPSELQPILTHLEETLTMLSRAFAREKQATADISHELRTPLAALLTTTDLALRKTRTAEELREMMLDCRLSAQTMNQIVERLLTLARLDAGVDLVRPQEVNLVRLVRQCAEIVRPLAEARGLKLDLRCDGELTVNTDPDKLREVLNNLLHNAIQYNRPDGVIVVTVTQREGRVVVEVGDTGIGIAPEACGRIFERFYRVDPSRGGDGMHAGLGLAIVKEYVELLGGTIAVESELGRGSTFRVDLPPVLART